MKYINLKKIISLITTGFVILSVSGCGVKDNTLSHVESKNYQSKPSIQVEEHIEPETKIIEVIEKEETKEKIENKDETIITYFNNLESQINAYNNESNLEKVEKKLKEIAVTGIDFIFYGAEIKGMTFEELTDSTKEKIMAIVTKIDIKIEGKLPNYKESIRDSFGNCYSYISNKLNKTIDYADAKLEQKYGEKYNQIKDKTSEINGEVKENVIDTYNFVKEKSAQGFLKVKSWYEQKTNKR